jgi:Delta7-sterol 5-desaturase
MLPIVLRDLAITIFFAGFWDFMLYSNFSPLKERAYSLKFNPAYPKDKQFVHDIFWSIVSTLISSVYEILLLNAWARGVITLHFPTQWWTDAYTIFWILFMPYPRIAHFFTIHRLMHTWNTTTIPDIGAFLYKHVHALHHLSRNPTSWSGVSMHPIESSLYYSAMLIPIYFCAHPIIFLFTKFDLTCAALIGHDGYGSPSTGSHDHWLHHNMVNCNYGENYLPLDWFFGTYAASEADFVEKFGRKFAEKSSKHE